MRRLVAVFFIATASHVDAESTVQTSAGPLRITEIAGGFVEPWGLGFLPDGRFLVTERAGKLTLHSADGTAETTVEGLPDLRVAGQGGLLDVMVPRDFDTSREVFLTYAAPMSGGAGTMLGVGRLSQDGTRLDGFRRLYATDPMPGGRHFGARVVEGPDGTIYLTTGDRGAGDPAQDPARAEGKVIALSRDGQPAQVIPDARAGVFSLGHRNIQGAAMDGQGRLWTVEHGARGGDELNQPQAGRNYGWPVISFGTDYDGSPLGEGTAKQGMEQPAHYWDPSIAPSGLAILSGDAIPEWKGDFLTGSLKFDHIARLDPDDGFAEERIASPETSRVRDVRQGPDGAIWFLSVGNGALYRMAP